MCEDEEVKFSDVVSRAGRKTMMLILGGCPDACITTPRMIFKNPSRSCPIRGTPDTVPVVCCRSQLKGQMDPSIFNRVGQRKENFSSTSSWKEAGYIYWQHRRSKNHWRSQGNFEKLQLTALVSWKKATYLCQPTERSIIQKVKRAWRELWDENKLAWYRRTRGKILRLALWGFWILVRGSSWIFPLERFERSTDSETRKIFFKIVWPWLDAVWHAIRMECWRRPYFYLTCRRECGNKE